MNYEKSYSQQTPQSRQVRRATFGPACALACLGLVLGLVALLVPLAPPAYAQAADARHPDRLLIGLYPDTDPANLDALLAPYGLEVERLWSDFHLAAVRPALQSASLADAAQVSAAAQEQLSAAALFRYVDVDAVVQIAETPNDPLLANQWAVAATNALAARQITGGDRRIVIAVLDTGFAFGHEDFDPARLWTNPAERDGVEGLDDDNNGYIDDIRGWDWVTRNNDPTDQHGHGTHVAGIIAALTDNGVGIAGVGGDLTIAPLRILDRFGSGYISDLISALDYASTQQFPIINLSLTVSSNFPALHDAIKAVHASGALIVTATGNSGSTVAFPAAYPETLAVAATGSAGQRAGFSNFGLAVDVAAPGEAVLSTHLNNGYRVLSGTSMAAPHVAALAGLIMSIRPDLTRAQVVEIILATAADINASVYPGEDIYLGAGQIDFAAALARATQDLDLQVDESVGAFALAGDDFSTFVQVFAPTPAAATTTLAATAPVPVPGAIIQYAVQNQQGEPVGIYGSASTDLNGTAQIAFPVPTTQGQYQVVTRLGAQESTFDLNVVMAPIALRIDLEQPAPQVGFNPVNFSVTLDDPEQVIVGQAVTLQLSTSAGRFSNNSTTLSVPLGAERLYSGQLIPGPTSGPATVIARIGSASGSATLQIRPGPAATIARVPTDSLIQVAQDRAHLEFIVRDTYGNQVEDGTQVLVSATYGTVTPNPVQTSGGRASVTLNVPNAWQWHYKHLTVRAWSNEGLAATEFLVALPRSYLMWLVR